MSSGLPDHTLEEGYVDLHRIKDAWIAHRRAILVVTLGVFLLSAFLVNLVQPRYTAEARAVIENQENFAKPSDKQSPDANQLLDPEAIQSQILILESRDLAREVVKSLNLTEREEFNPSVNIFTRIAVAFGLQPDPARRDPIDRVLDVYFNRLSIYSPSKTRGVIVEFTSTDPDLAAKTANQIMALYLNAQSLAKRDIARQAANSLATAVADLKVKIAAAEAKASEFRAQSGLLVGNGGGLNISNQQLGDLATQLSLARAQQADVQAKAKLIRDMLKQGRIEEVPDVANNDLIRRINEQRTVLTAQLASESRTLLPAHPRIIELKAQLADINNSLRQAAEKAARTLDNDARIAGSRLENIQQILEAQKKQVGAAGADDVTLRQYESEAKGFRDQLDLSVARYQEALAREADLSAPADARIISRAVPPALPTYPKKLPIVALSTLATFLFLSAMAVAGEILSGQASNHRPVQPVPDRSKALPPKQSKVSHLKKPRLFAALLELKPWEKWRRGYQNIAINTVENPTMPLVPPEPLAVDKSSKLSASSAEPPSMAGFNQRSLHLANSVDLPFYQADSEELLLKFDECAEDGKATIALVSVLESDWESLVMCSRAALTLGRALSRQRRTILVNLEPMAVDIDETVLEPNLGIARVLLQQVDIAEVLQRDSQSRLQIIPSGLKECQIDQELLEQILDALCEIYDNIIVVSPSLDLSDKASCLTPTADMCFLVVGRKEVEPLIRTVVGRLHQQGCDDICLLGMVPKHQFVA